MAERGKELEAFKKAATDLAYDLHGRRVLDVIPMSYVAGLLMVVIAACVFVLPKSSSPPPPVQTAPVAATDATGEPKSVSGPAKLSLVNGLSLDEASETYDPYDPFGGKRPVKCRTIVASRNVVVCDFDNLVGAWVCISNAENAPEECKKGKSKGATGGGGATDATGGTDTPGGGGGGGGSTKTTVYTVTVEYDGKTYKNVESGDALPSSGSAVVFYAGPNSSGKKSKFVIGDSVSVQGAELDEDLGSFEMAVDDEVILTDKDDVVHSLTLTKITKTTQ